MLGIALLILTIYFTFHLIYKRIKNNEKYFELRGVPFMKPKFILGNTGTIILRQYSLPEYATELYKAFPKETINGLFDFQEPFYLLRDPEMIRKLMVKDFDYFLDHHTLLNSEVDDMFGNSLFMLRGDKWRDMRATLSPAFTGSKMRQMFDLVSECAERMSEYYVEESKNGKRLDLEMKEIFSRYATDVIATCAFGIQVDSFHDQNNEFFQIGKRAISFKKISAFLRILLIRIVPSVMKLLNIQFIEKDVGAFFRNVVLNTMKVRKREKIFRPDVINLLMQVRDGHVSNNKLLDTDDNNHKLDEGFSVVQESHIGRRQVKTQWNDTEIVAQCFLFFAAGFDTSSTLLSFLVYELTLNKDIQNRLYREIKNANDSLNGSKLTYDEMQKLRYMDMVISEALRKWPPAPMTDRVCLKDYYYDDGNKLRFVIEKDIAIWIPIYGFHHDPNFFPNPESFDPERFNEENAKLIVPGTYLPFGIGPRNCIGSRFALMEMKIVIYYLLLNFEFEKTEKTQIPIVLEKSPNSIIPQKGIHLELNYRK